MGKPNGYEVHNPEHAPPVPEKETKKRRKKLTKAALARSHDEVVYRQENHVRAARFTPQSRKGTRGEKRRNALRDANDS